eukprot:12377136-Alexandrium_andersonii.AAC.1
MHEPCQVGTSVGVEPTHAQSAVGPRSARVAPRLDVDKVCELWVRLGIVRALAIVHYAIAAWLEGGLPEELEQT